jgi:Na+-transporting NADH:ubiquinone oxidoreductase subunit NqrB
MAGWVTAGMNPALSRRLFLFNQVPCTVCRGLVMAGWVTAGMNPALTQRLFLFN